MQGGEGDRYVREYICSPPPPTPPVTIPHHQSHWNLYPDCIGFSPPPSQLTSDSEEDVTPLIDELKSAAWWTRRVPRGDNHQADTKDLTSSSKFSGSCVLSLQTHPSKRRRNLMRLEPLWTLTAGQSLLFIFSFSPPGKYYFFINWRCGKNWKWRLYLGFSGTLVISVTKNKIFSDRSWPEIKCLYESLSSFPSGARE